MGRSRNGGRDKLSKRKRKTRHLRRKSYVKLPKRVHTGGVTPAERTALSGLLRQLEERISRLRQEKMELERELGDCRSQSQTTHRAWLRLRQEKMELERALDDCRGEIARHEQTNLILQGHNLERQEENERLQEELRGRRNDNHEPQ